MSHMDTLEITMMNRKELIEKNLLLLTFEDKEIKDLILNVLFPNVINLTLKFEIEKFEYTHYEIDEDYICSDIKLSIIDTLTGIKLFEGLQEGDNQCDGNDKHIEHHMLEIVNLIFRSEFDEIAVLSEIIGKFKDLNIEYKLITEYSFEIEFAANSKEHKISNLLYKHTDKIVFNKTYGYVKQKFDETYGYFNDEEDYDEEDYDNE